MDARDNASAYRDMPRCKAAAVRGHRLPPPAPSHRTAPQHAQLMATSSPPASAPHSTSCSSHPVTSRPTPQSPISAEPPAAYLHWQPQTQGLCFPSLLQPKDTNSISLLYSDTKELLIGLQLLTLGLTQKRVQKCIR